MSRPSKRAAIVLEAVAVALLAVAVLRSCTSSGEAPRPHGSTTRTATSPTASTATRPASRPGVPPVTVGSIVSCPPRAPIRAAGGSYFPPSFPSDDAPIPARCFASERQARDAGLELAPAPPGGVRIGGVYLEPVDPELTRECRAAARRLGFLVACPTLLPAPASAADPGVLIGRRSDFRQFLIEQGFLGPDSYVGAGTTGSARTPVGHLWVQTDPGRLTPRALCLSEPTEVEPATVDGHPASFADCTEGSSTHSGHVVLVWRASGVTVTVSLHGHTELNRRLDARIAAAVELVGR